MPSDPIIRAQGLTKTYGEVQAVAGISFDIAAGESFGLLGPNGAGKSTTMRMIGGTLGRSGGHLAVAGLDPEVEGSTVRAHLGVVPQQDNLDEELSVRDNLYIYGRYFGLPRSYLRAKIPELLDFAQLSEKSSAKVDRLSVAGLRDLARGLLGRRILGYSDARGQRRRNHADGKRGKHEAFHEREPNRYCILVTMRAGMTHGARVHPLSSSLPWPIRCSSRTSASCATSERSLPRSTGG